MAILHKILGRPFEDNSLYLELNLGEEVVHFLFDCGSQAVPDLKMREIASLDHLFISHFHMDHVSGFDSILRVLYNREKPFHVWGPERTAEYLHNRLLGYAWNLVEDQPGTIYVSDVEPHRIKTWRFQTCEGFRSRHLVRDVPNRGVLIDEPDYVVTGILLDHGIPSLGCMVREKDKFSINSQKLAVTGLPTGPWLQGIKDPDRSDDEEVSIANQTFRLGNLRKELLITKTGQSCAYLTDFFLDETNESRIFQFLEGVETLVCEGQYLPDEAEHARRNFHMTIDRSAYLANQVKARDLILIHLSERYRHLGVDAILRETQQSFPNTSIALGGIPEKPFGGQVSSGGMLTEDC